MESGQVVMPTPALPPLSISINTNNQTTNTTWYDHNSNSGSNCSTPYISAPSSPQRPINLFFYSAPPSPRTSIPLSPLSHDHGLPFKWETKPGVPKSLINNKHHTDDHFDDDEEEEEEEVVDDGFEFEFSGQLDTKVRDSLSSADELFSGGKIRPLKPPPAAMITNVDSPKSPRSPMSKFREALSPKHRKKDDHDPFEAALKKTSSSIAYDYNINKNNNAATVNRGRSRNNGTNNQRGISRSLSPLRVSEFASLANPKTSSTSSSSSLSSSSGKKWRLKDLLLFRSASEGRAEGKDPLRRFFTRKGGEEDEKRGEGSFRSSEGSGSGSMSRRRERGVGVSAHEMHYTVNRAVSEELKKKTSLPYKHGLLGCLGFHHGVNDVSKVFGSFAGKY